MIMLSAVTVNLNNKKGLLTTCRSIRKLKEKQWFEHIIVDGGSSDGSTDHIPAPDLLRTTVISETDRGIYDAMNKGVVASRGVYIWMLNSGDEFADEISMENYIHSMKQNNIDLALFGSYIVDTELNYRWRHFVNYRKLSYMMSVVHQSVLVKREAHRQYGLYHLKYKLASDYAFISSLAMREYIRTSISRKPLSIYYIGGLSDKHFMRTRLEISHSTGNRSLVLAFFSASYFLLTFVSHKTRKLRNNILVFLNPFLNR